MQTQFNSSQYQRKSTIITVQLQKDCDGVLQNIYRMRVSKNRVLRGIIKTNRKELTGGSTKLHMISIICIPVSDISQVLESRKMRCVWHVTQGLDWEKETKN
jgi:hypothetical protein